MNNYLKEFGNIFVKLYNGNIADCKSDIIVNAANSGLWMGGGVAGAIRSKGGIEIQQEALKYRPAKIGDIIITGAGKLDAKYIFHAVVIDELFRQGTNLETVELALENIINKIQNMNQKGDEIKSIAIPFLGTGVGRLKLEDVAYQTLRVFEKESKKLDKRLYITLPILRDNEFTQVIEAFNSYEPIEEENRKIDKIAKEYINYLGEGFC